MKKIKNTKSFFIKFLILLLLLTIIIEGVYFGKKYYENNEKINKINEQIQISKQLLDTLTQMKEGEQVISNTEKLTLEDKHVKLMEVEDSFKVTKIDILLKVEKKGEPYIYYKANLYYNAKDLDAVKDLIALKYIDNNVYKIIKVTPKYIELILQEKK